VIINEPQQRFIVKADNIQKTDRCTSSDTLASPAQAIAKFIQAAAVTKMADPMVKSLPAHLMGHMDMARKSISNEAIPDDVKRNIHHGGVVSGGPVVESLPAHIMGHMPRKGISNEAIPDDVNGKIRHGGVVSSGPLSDAQSKMPLRDAQSKIHHGGVVSGGLAGLVDDIMRRMPRKGISNESILDDAKRNIHHGGVVSGGPISSVSNKLHLLSASAAPTSDKSFLNVSAPGAGVSAGVTLPISTRPRE
jgi:hypothetical protein